MFQVKIYILTEKCAESQTQAETDRDRHRVLFPKDAQHMNVFPKSIVALCSTSRVENSDSDTALCSTSRVDKWKTPIAIHWRASLSDSDSDSLANVLKKRRSSLTTIDRALASSIKQANRLSAEARIATSAVVSQPLPFRAFTSPCCSADRTSTGTTTVFGVGQCRAQE